MDGYNPDNTPAHPGNTGSFKRNSGYYPSPGNTGSLKKNSGYYPAVGNMDSMHRNSGYEWDRSASYNNQDIDPFDEEEKSCCKRFAGHAKGVGVALILLGVVIFAAQIVSMLVGSYLSVVATGIWSGLVFILCGTFGIKQSNQKTQTMVYTYTVFSHLGILCAFILILVSAVGIQKDWELTEGCGYFGWRRWFDGECITNQTKIAMAFTLASCGLVVFILCIYSAVGCWYSLNWCCGSDSIKEPIPRQHSSPIYTVKSTKIKKPRRRSSGSSNPDLNPPLINQQQPKARRELMDSYQPQSHANNQPQAQYNHYPSQTSNVGQQTRPQQYTSHYEPEPVHTRQPLMSDV